MKKSFGKTMNPTLDKKMITGNRTKKQRKQNLKLIFQLMWIPPYA